MAKNRTLFQIFLIFTLTAPILCMHKPNPKETKTDEMLMLEKLADLFAQQLRDCQDLYDQCLQDVHEERAIIEKKQEKKQRSTKKKRKKSIILSIINRILTFKQ